ncbi:phosphatase PAP2/dual specificity phosphatase family protein [Chitinibacter sp. FCG-7]|uniref:Phosphatase PAP2/dual specificity phosphatase family protein n=1 Tax=Chitinibacter mangrovi TaxID=3153927 RepID=A0AAU7FAC1_9NEIS
MKNQTHPDGLPWRSAILWLLLAGPAFFLFYGNANQYATSLPPEQVGNIVFAWERDTIPFWPWSIVPYWSIDLMFGFSLLLCADQREVRTQALRLMLATLLSSICFVLWPLRFGWDRPAVDGLFGAMFAALGQIDQPFNQAPSLHISLLVIIWLRFAAYLTHPLARGVLHLWCTLIGISVLTTWQHHFIDIPTGFAMGLLVCYLLPMPPLVWCSAREWRAGLIALQRQKSRQLALRYGAGAAFFAVVVLSLQGWAWLLAWPAVALAIVAAAYGGLGPVALQKIGGETSFAVRWLTAPYRLGAALSRWYFLRQVPPAVEVAEGVWLGASTAAGDPRFAAVLDLCAEIPRQVHPAAAYINLPRLDLLPPNADEIAQGVAAIESLRDRTTGPLLVHCALGFSRSATVIAAWLVQTGRASDIAAAIAHLRQLRAVHLNASQIEWAGQGASRGNCE